VQKYFIALKQGLTSKATLIEVNPNLTVEQNFSLNDDLIIDNKKDYYTSLYYYNEAQKSIFEQTGSFAGIKDTQSNRLFFDLDSKDLKEAQKQSTALALDLVNYGISEESIHCSFTGSKGFCLEVYLTEFINPVHLKSVLSNFNKKYNTIDTVVADPVRIIRLPNSRHPNSGLYKIPLTLEELESLPIDEIVKLASTPRKLDRNVVKSVLPGINEFSKLTRDTTNKLTSEVQQTNTKVVTSDFSDKPKEWRNCKWSLLQGNFESGNRHQALLTLAATCRGLGYDRETAYYMLKSAVKKQARKFNQDEFSTDEIWENILESVYSTTWQGGQYSCEVEGPLHDYCQSLGEHACKKHEQKTIQIHDAFGLFKDYATNIDKLTIKTGIKALDERVRLTIGMFVGIVAPPSTGKTSIAIQILNTMSKNNELCIFLSYDMYHSLVIQKLVQKHMGLQSEAIFNKMKQQDPEFERQVLELLQKEYKNIEFCFDAGQTIPQIEETIRAVEEKRGQKSRLVIVDYNELILTEMGDATASSALVAQKLREISHKFNCCVISLLQPGKVYANPADTITTYQAAKGSSAVAQAVSVMLGINRPGFHPEHPEDDKFLSITCLKNRMGGLFKIDQYWDGLSGTVRDLTFEESRRLDDIKEARKQEKESANAW